jgi:hypothetical protein
MQFPEHLEEIPFTLTFVFSSLNLFWQGTQIIIQNVAKSLNFLCFFF